MAHNLSAELLQNLSNASLDHYLRGQLESQVLQDRPLFNDLMAGVKTFPGGEEFIKGNVKGVYSSSMTGYSGDDDQNYVNPGNIKQWKAKWYEVSSGIKVTFTELKAQGIHVADSAFGKDVGPLGEDGLQIIDNIMADKNEDLMEGSKRSFAEMLWRDGTQDSKAVPGILSFILDAPTTGTTFGIDRAANSWWRNIASLSIDTSTASNNNLINDLQLKFRQLRRDATPKHKIYAGTTWMDAMEKEMRSKGNYTQDGWSKTGRLDPSMADMAFKGVEIVYEPLLDDLSRQKYAYILDLKAIKLRPMEGEAFKVHNPARPPEKLVLYRGMTWTGALTANRLNSSMVSSIL